MINNERIPEIKITFVIPGSDGGGVRSVVRIAAGLEQRGHNLRILYRKQSQSPRNIVRSVYLAMRYGKKPQWIKSFLGNTEPYRKLTSEIVGHNDVIVGVGISCVLEIADLPDTCGIKIHNSRGVEPWIEEDMRRAWKISMPRIIVGSHLNPLMREMGCHDHIHLAHNGIDIKEYYPSKPEDQRNGVGTIYHGHPVKDPTLILTTLNRIHDSKPSVPLYVFGTYPRPRKLPKKAIYVRYPSLEQARDLYSSSTVWFVASKNEGFSNPILEAMACGAVAVSTDCGGSADIIHSGNNGFIVPVGDVLSMTKSIIEILEDSEQRNKIVAQSYYTLSRYTWSNAVIQMENAIIKIVDHRNANCKQNKD